MKSSTCCWSNATKPKHTYIEKTVILSVLTNKQQWEMVDFKNRIFYFYCDEEPYTTILRLLLLGHLLFRIESLKFTFLFQLVYFTIYFWLYLTNISLLKISKMKFSTAEDKRAHILDPQSNVWSVIREIIETNNQEDAFYICNISDIVRKQKMWAAKLPRVQPHYGWFALM